MKKHSEDLGHNKLKNETKKIMENCGFKCDREVHLCLSGNKKDGRFEDERSIDLIAFFKENGKNCMFFFECKNRDNLNPLNKEINSWESDIEKILSKKNRNKVKILSSEDKLINKNYFNKVDEIRLCFVFGEKFKDKTYDEYQEKFKEKNFSVWNYKALKYYYNISSTIGHISKYELFREFNIFFESDDYHSEQAIEISQSNSQKMYLLGMHPGLLMEIGYVSRRTSHKPMAYQRILDKNHINEISNFIKSKGSFLANSIIIAFDNKEAINYSKGKLTFPLEYCSAWIIDGQHRLYGFKNTIYEKWVRNKNDEFKLPVVAFIKLNEELQSKTFIDINFKQKKIDTMLLCDIASTIKDLNNELTWPSLLVEELNKKDPLESMIKISELDKNKSITLAGFVNNALLYNLLGYNKKTKEYKGPLFKYANFNNNLPFNHKKNKETFNYQVDLLVRYFKAVKKNTKKDENEINPWINLKKYALLKPTGINSLLLVLSKILDKYPNMDIDLDDYLESLKDINFERKYVASKGGGWKGFKNLADEILIELNKKHNNELILYSN